MSTNLWIENVNQTQRIKERRRKEYENHIILAKHKCINDHGSRVGQSCIYKIRWARFY